MSYTPTTYVNGSSPYINDTNLNKNETQLAKLSNYTELLVASVSTTTTDALISNISDYDFIDIFYTFKDNENNIIGDSKRLKVTGAEMKTMLFGAWFTTTTNIQMQPLGITISGTNITFGHNSRMNVATTGNTIQSGNMGITITSIIGYKY